MERILDTVVNADLLADGLVAWSDNGWEFRCQELRDQGLYYQFPNQPAPLEKFTDTLYAGDLILVYSPLGFSENPIQGWWKAVVIDPHRHEPGVVLVEQMGTFIYDDLHQLIKKGQPVDPFFCIDNTDKVYVIKRFGISPRKLVGTYNWRDYEEAYNWRNYEENVDSSQT